MALLSNPRKLRVVRMATLLSLVAPHAVALTTSGTISHENADIMITVVFQCFCVYLMTMKLTRSRCNFHQTVALMWQIHTRSGDILYIWCHDWAVTTSTKLWPDLIISNKNAAKWIFTRVELRAVCEKAPRSIWQFAADMLMIMDVPSGNCSRNVDDYGCSMSALTVSR